MHDTDELEIEVDDVELRLEPAAPELRASLPLVAPSAATPLPMTVDFRTELELDADAGKLFDFSGTKLTAIQQVYIVAYATRGTKRGACKLAGVPYSAVAKWMEDEEFSAAMLSVVDIIKDTLEEELLRRAMGGSDKLLLEALKATNPEKYNKRQSDVNISGNVMHTFADLARMAVTAGTPPIEATYTEEEE